MPAYEMVLYKPDSHVDVIVFDHKHEAEMVFTTVTNGKYVWVAVEIWEIESVDSDDKGEVIKSWTSKVLVQ